MKKITFIFSFVFLLVLFSTNLEKVYAAVGDRSTPFSAWENHRFTLQEYSWDKPKVVELQLKTSYYGSEANNIIESENMFNQTPASDEQWVLMGFNLKYVSGPEETLEAEDVIWSGKSIYTTSGQKISPINTAAFSERLDGYSEYDVELYPGAESEVWYGLLVKKTVGFPLIRIEAGYDSTTNQTKYIWFSTDPNYKEPAKDTEKPIISGANDTTIIIGEPFDKLKGVTAADNLDGNVTSLISVSGKVDNSKSGIYSLTYKVADKSGNVATVTRKITVIDNVKPVILGANNTTIKLNSTFNLKTGVTAKDNVDGNLTSLIKITGSVNTKKKGTYTLTYTVTDKSGNKAVVTRKITVK